jgi:hypothetical protein
MEKTYLECGKEEWRKKYVLVCDFNGRWLKDSIKCGR